MSTRTAARALRSAPAQISFKKISTRSIAAAPRLFQQQARRNYSHSSSSSSKSTPNSPPLIYTSLAAAFLGGAAVYVVHIKPGLAESPSSSKPKSATKGDYQAVCDAIAQRLLDEDDYDDGSYGPVVLRLGWHASGTYDAATKTGGSNGATMRFPPESDHSANSGLKAARDFLEPIHAEFPWISYSDVWTLGAVCAIQEMSGPDIPWRPGRSDRDVSYCTPDGRLPDGAKGHRHLRDIFGRMGFNDQEIVALSGAHALGRCHKSRSGFDGPWTFSPITFTNDFFKLLVDEKWHIRDWNGNKQWEDNGSKSLMMLPTDMALVEDEKFRVFVEKYAQDAEGFFNHFSKVVVKLFELGVPFENGEQDRMVFKRME